MPSAALRRRLGGFERLRIPVRPGKAGLKGLRCDSSRNSERRPAGANPVRARAEPAHPEARLATFAAMRTAMRSHASVWAVGNAASKIISVRVPSGLDSAKAMAAAAQQGEQQPHPAGCTTTARRKRTAQAPGRPTFLLGRFRSHGDPVTHLRRAVRTRMRARPADSTQVGPQRRSICAEVGRGQGETGAAAEGSVGVGGPNTSVDVGERGGTRTRPSKGGPC